MTVVTRVARGLIGPVVGLVLAIILIQWQGFQALPTIAAGVQYSVGDGVSIARTVAYGLPLCLAAVGATVAFRTGMFTLGAQGQIYAGALVTAVVGAWDLGLPPVLHQALCLLAASVVGGLLSGALGWLRAVWRVDEVLSSLFSTYILMLLCAYLANGPLLDPDAEAPGATVEVLDTARFANLVPRSQLGWAVVVVAVVCLGVWWLVERSTIGYRWRMAGQSPGFANAVGIDVRSGQIGAMALSGVLSGLAGAVLVMAAQGRFTTDIAVGIGWIAIMLALMARSRPAFAVLWVAIYSVMQASGRRIEQVSDVPASLPLILICAILFAAAAGPGTIALLSDRIDRWRNVGTR